MRDRLLTCFRLALIGTAVFGLPAADVTGAFVSPDSSFQHGFRTHLTSDSQVNTLQFHSPTYPKDWGDINFSDSGQTWKVNSGSVNVEVPGSRHLLWSATIESPNNITRRVRCTSGTEYPANGGSYFEATCQDSY